MTSQGPRIVVVGAGIVGASIAYHLARRNAAVTQIDRGQAGADVTARSFGWINVSHGFPEPYLQLRHLAIQEYRRLEQELGSFLPIIGFSSDIDGIYIAAMHAGVTLAPAIGRFAATEILDGVDVKMLETCRPDRFAGADA